MSEDLDARMKAAGMLSISEMLARNPLGDFAIHKDVKDLASFEQWLILRRKESLELQARMELDKERGDELYEWAIAHSAVFGEVLINYKAAIRRLFESQVASIGCNVLSAEADVPSAVKQQEAKQRSYHDVWFSIDGGEKKQIFDQAFSLKLICTRFGGWELWNHIDGLDVLVASEFGKCKLRVEVDGLTVCGELSEQELSLKTKE